MNPVTLGSFSSLSMFRSDPIINAVTGRPVSSYHPVQRYPGTTGRHRPPPPTFPVHFLLLEEQFKSLM